MKRLLVCSILISCGCSPSPADIAANKRQAYMVCLRENITRPTVEAKALCEPLLK